MDDSHGIKTWGYSGFMEFEWNLNSFFSYVNYESLPRLRNSPAEIMDIHGRSLGWDS